jgi:hypothetical protein
MAIKKESGGSKKPVAKKTTATGAAKKTTTSRGSNTIRQVGDQNMREYYQSNSEKNNKAMAAMDKKYKTTKSPGYYSKVKELGAITPYMGVDDKFRAMQRAGGKVLSTKEQKIKNATSKARGSKTATSNYNKVEATRLSKTTKPKRTTKVVIDPSSASAAIRAAKKKMTSGDATTDYEVSRAADAYAKALKKYGVKITPANWGKYKPGPGSNAMGVANKPKGSLAKSKRTSAGKGKGK